MSLPASEKPTDPPTSGQSNDPPTSDQPNDPPASEQPANPPASGLDIEVDVSATDTDSAYGDGESSYSTSLTPSVMDYPWEHGRRYHAYGDKKYPLPNDEPENERLDMMHEILVARGHGKLHLAPIGDSPQRILDIGCGTGIWAVEMGDKYPSAIVIGNDLSPIQPTLVPPNVRFEVDDVEKPWLHREPFDYIHCRYMMGAIVDWPGLFAQCYKHTKVGGWVEFADLDGKYYSQDGSLKPEHHRVKWNSKVIEGCKKIGREPRPGPLLEGWMRDAGFKNIRHERLPLPVGTWPKDPELKRIGAWNFIQTEEGLEAFTLRLFTGVLGWTPEETHVLLAFVREEMKDPRVHTIYDYHITYGQKVEES